MTYIPIAEAKTAPEKKLRARDIIEHFLIIFVSTTRFGATTAGSVVVADAKIRRLNPRNIPD